jgi:hypothetical protein
MSASDNQKLNDILSNPPVKLARVRGGHDVCVDEGCPPANIIGDSSGEKELSGLVQWTTGDGKRFVPASRTAKKITPGVYEIQKFWDKEPIFREYGLTHKRGIIMWGPPGSGKSCTIQLIMRDVVDRQGVVIKFTHPTLFNEGMRKFREIEPDTPVVVLMEDIDSIIANFNESEVLNILDGINQIEKAVFLATTNYPENLGARIVNRPSRFDKRFFIGHPDAESRKLYFRHIIGDDKIAALNLNLDKWVEDTEEFSIAHLKELFTAVVILSDDYEDAIETLRTMKEENISSSNDEARRAMGFGMAQKRMYKQTKRSYGDDCCG